MDAQGFGDNHEYLRSKLKYDKNDVEGLLLGEFFLSFKACFWKEIIFLIFKKYSKKLNLINYRW